MRKNGSHGQPANHSEDVFGDSIKLKNTLDLVEEASRSEPSWKRLSILVNCEYQLYSLNQRTPLRNNPFLSHWVEVVQRLEKTSVRNSREDWSPKNSDGTISSDEICTVRMELIKSLLQSRDLSQFAQLTPEQLHKNFATLGQTTSLSVMPFIQMLEEEGVYEKPDPPDQLTTPAAPEQLSEVLKDKTGERSKGKGIDRPKSTSQGNWKEELLIRLEKEPDVAVNDIQHLPIDLKYLDFLTTLLQDEVLQRMYIDPSTVINGYVQHALRLVEKMGEPPGVAAVGPSNTINGGLDEGDAGMELGREAQSRAVKLMLLFMRNVIRKALLPTEALFFEIQEICVRYMWLKEVREFKTWVEGSVGEQAMI
ncbi:hypothetical protein EJ04DRAFT_425427 [Polyplosphaeria fusca]|uniref:CCR4-NOT transcription complex subunit 11 n=1 Tax=Polyplosphaeria fusca TaxID=682080 RepID=A0A9P4V987_9PLEO|nr:hypothetical protein EJ04DRAFT_425427 [Polyplosphaeria fusca]